MYSAAGTCACDAQDRRCHCSSPSPACAEVVAIESKQRIGAEMAAAAASYAGTIGQELSDECLIEEIRAGHTAAFEFIMRRHNQRLYRVAYSILRDPAEAEDAMQEAYMRAFQFLHQFEGRSKFSTWLTRIAVHEALARTHHRDRYVSLDVQAPISADRSAHPQAPHTPEQAASNSELRGILQGMIAALPSHYRAVLELRDIHEVSTEEAAGRLRISQENVKIRLHRARAMMRTKLQAHVPAVHAMFRAQQSSCTPADVA
jgi:RNA polymerase sigma-70 factor (ECF subfamily)